MPKLLFLGFAFPPGVAALYPHLNPAGHALETQLIAGLRSYFEIRSAGLLPLEAPQPKQPDPATGIPHEVLLIEKPPELYHRLRSLARLKREYRSWLGSGWKPDVVLVYNLSPVYNQFLTWLRRSPGRPHLALLLLDSPNLGQKTSWFKQLRRRCKPMHIPDVEMLTRFDSCIGLSQSAAAYFGERCIPFLWMPGGCTPSRALAGDAPYDFGTKSSPFRIGYFGALGAHAGVSLLVENFLALNMPATLEICGYGKWGEVLRELAGGNERLNFLGLLTPADCLRFGRSCDLLVNPRPATHGNENNFPSKIFDYALCGRAILTSQLSGIENVLGPDAFYFEPRDFNRSLQQQLSIALQTPKTELNRRGAAMQQRVLRDFSWDAQTSRVARFLLEILRTGAWVQKEERKIIQGKIISI